MEGTAIIELNKTLETTRNNRLVHGKLVLGIVRDLKDHSANKVAAVKDLEVNLHVEWNLSLVFFLFILSSFLLVTAVTLCKEFLVLGVVTNIG